MDDIISRQAAIGAIKRAVTKEAAIWSVESLPSVQSEPCEDAEFWQKRAEYYSKICLDLIAGMNQDVKLDSIEINEEGINFKMTQPEPCEDAVSRNVIFKNLTRWIDTTQANSEELRLCDTDKKFPKNEVFIVDDVYEEIVESLSSAQPEPQWHKYSENDPSSFPDDDRRVLISVKNYSDPAIGWYQHDNDGGGYWTFGSEIPLTEFGLFVEGWWELPKKPTLEK